VVGSGKPADMVGDTAVTWGGDAFLLHAGVKGLTFGAPVDEVPSTAPTVSDLPGRGCPGGAQLCLR
jgi:hypothetical protein